MTPLPITGITNNTIITGANTGYITSNNIGTASVPHITAGLTVTGDITLNGQSVSDRLACIELLLNIPTRDVKMEKKYPKLKQLHKAYMEELAKLKTWDTLKESK
jgi:hypothetical protein